MTIYNFQLLDNAERADALYQHGVYIGKRTTGDSVAVLYQLNGFYVEVTYRRYRRSIAHIRCGSTTALLEPYLDQVAVPDLQTLGSSTERGL